jgi:hypothetical protein
MKVTSEADANAANAAATELPCTNWQLRAILYSQLMY